MKLTLRRLIAEDFKDQSAWIDKLIQPINDFFERATSALNKSLTISDNFAGAMKTVELDGVFPLKVSWDVASRPISVLVGNVSRSDGSSFTLSSAVQVQWTFNQNGQLQIDGVTGIVPSSTEKYRLLLECKSG